MVVIHVYLKGVQLVIYVMVGVFKEVWVGGGMQTYNAAQRSASAAEGDRQHGRALLRIEGHPPVLIHRS